MRPNYMNTVLDVYSDLDARERQTFLLHMGYSICDGLVAGVLTLNEFVFLKNLEPGSFKLSLLFQLAVLVLPFSIFFNQFFEKSEKKKKILLRINLITRLPLLLFFIFPFFKQYNVPIELQQNLFLGIFLLYYFATPFTLPFINTLLKANYRPEKLGKLYSYAISVNMLTMLVSSLVFGNILDHAPGIYNYVYCFSAVVGGLALYLISRISTSKLPELQNEMSLIESWKNTLVDTFSVLKINKPFRDFQIGMMIYGIAFLMNLGVVALFLNNVLQLNYTEIASYKGLASGISIIAFPLFGILLDKQDPRRFAMISFFLVVMYFVMLVLAHWFPFSSQIGGFHIFGFVLLGYLFFGLFNSSMTILWGIGSSYFAKPEDAGKFHSIHCTLTGLRGILAPIAGALIYSWFGFSGAFIASILLLTIAILYCRYSVRKHKMVA